QLLIERAAIDTDADWLAVVARYFANGGELFIAAMACANIAGIDAVFIERLCAVRIFCEQDVPVVMEVADDWNITARCEKALLDFGDGGCGLRVVDGPANDFGSGFSEF